MAKNMMNVQVRHDLSGVDHYLGPRFMGDVGSSTRNAAEGIVSDIRANWSSQSPSTPGNPPAVVTGALDKSIKVMEGRDVAGRFATTANAVSYGITVESEYGAAQEFGDPIKNLAARPFLRPALFRFRSKLGDVFRTAFRFRMRR